MAKQSLNTLKNWFKTGLKPLQVQFWHWMDSFWHKDELIPATTIDGLQGLLDSKVDKKDAVDPEQVGVYDPAKNYVYDPLVAEYVSFSNPASEEPKFTVEGFYRLTENAPAGQNPETHPAHWSYQGTVLGEITINDVVGLREELDDLAANMNSFVSRITKSLLIVDNVIAIDYEGKTQFVSNNLLLVTANASISFSNQPQSCELQFRVNIANMATLTFPAGTYMQESEGRWDSINRVFTPESDGKYEVVITIVDGDYYLKISDLMISL